MSSADNFLKHFGQIRPKFCWARSVGPDLDPSCLTHCFYIWKNILKTVKLKNICRCQQNHEKMPSMQRFNSVWIWLAGKCVNIFIQALSHIFGFTLKTVRPDKNVNGKSYDVYNNITYIRSSQQNSDFKVVLMSYDKKNITFMLLYYWLS